jgi:hypothetical protein
MHEFDKGLDAPILDFMSIPAVDLRKLVKIIRQYEVIYGGGISTSDAAVREECEDLVGRLEAELGNKKGSSKPGKMRLPSLVDAKRKPHSGGFPKPTTTRTSEIARLGSPRREESPVKEEARNAEPKAARSSGKAPARRTEGKAKPESRSKAGARADPTASAEKGKASRPRASEKQTAAKPPPAELSASGGGRKDGRGLGSVAIKAAAVQPAGARAEDEVYKDVRSRNVGAARAAAERADKIAGSAEDSGNVEAKHHFAALHLFDAFKKSKLPKYGGFIVCVRFVEERGYTVIEIIGYENLQDLYPEGDTLVFKSVGCKLFAIVEPAGYLLKSVEPVNRPAEQAVPYRFSELLRITTKRFQNVLIGRKPVFMPTSFSVFKPAGDDLAVLFYDIADVYANIQDFLIMIFRDRLELPVTDSRKAAEVIARGIREFRLWMDEA